MKYLLLLLFVGCANTNYKRHSFATVKYTVREYYLPVAQDKPVISHKRPIKPKKVVKKSYKPNCGQVLKDINYCAR